MVIAFEEVSLFYNLPDAITGAKFVFIPQLRSLNSYVKLSQFVKPIKLNFIY